MFYSRVSQLTYPDLLCFSGEKRPASDGSSRPRVRIPQPSDISEFQSGLDGGAGSSARKPRKKKPRNTWLAPAACWEITGCHVTDAGSTARDCHVTWSDVPAQEGARDHVTSLRVRRGPIRRVTWHRVIVWPKAPVWTPKSAGARKPFYRQYRLWRGKLTTVLHSSGRSVPVLSITLPAKSETGHLCAVTSM